jgi:hypothetical protein
MAIVGTPEASRGILGAIKGALGLFDSTNKAVGGNDESNPMPIDEYESTLSETKIIELTSVWKRQYSTYYTEIEKSQKLAFEYWVGKHRTDNDSIISTAMFQPNDLVDNVLFEAIETFLPIATRANPEPLVTADPSEMGQQIAKDVKVALAHEADIQKLRRKLAKGTRHWILNRLGVWKIGWDPLTESIRTDVINPTKMGFDPDGYIDEGGFFRGEWTYEKKKQTAEKLTELFPKKKQFIIEKCQGKMGTKFEYYEWWYCGTDVFYTLDQEVLGKFKNPNWNYDGKVKEIDPVTGAETEVEVRGTNHFKEMSFPYVFLSIFSTGRQPHDDTSLIIQNISNQDRVNRRNRQVDKNVEGMNNGMVVSGKSFTEEQASQAAAALRRGVAIRVPDGDVGKAVARFAPTPIPQQVFEDRDDARNELRNIFGTSGSTPQGTENQDTVRGKIMVNQMDSSRIGGGITECIEQVADTIYNMWTQMMFVYYDQEHFFVSAGATSGAELVALKNDRFPMLKTLNITVKEGTLIPKDPLTQRNEAIDLWSQNAIDPLTFFKKLDYPDPAEATNQLILWQLLQKGLIQPQQYLPTFEVAQPVAPMGAPQGTGGPAVNPPPNSMPPEGPQQAPPGSPGAVQAQSQQLLNQVPIR